MKKILYKINVIVIMLVSLINMFMPVALAKETDDKSSNSQIYYFGDAVACGKDNGYIPSSTIKSKDPHYGWELGKFYVSGYTGKYVGTQNSYNKMLTTFTKNVGDTVEFGFRLDQNINKLNGKSGLSISEDRKLVQDCWIQEPYFKADFKKGLLMIVHTDYLGNKKIVKYVDFLNGKKQGANTTVELFEEGDYRVILCYEIYLKTGLNFITDLINPDGSYYNYRMEECFSIRNGNCMVYPFEVDTDRELTNECLTKRGFRIDLANSRYLNVTVKKEILNDSGDDLVLDTRFNKDVADGTVFTEEGKYTITVYNPTTGAKTEKVIYVGKNKLMKANAVTGKSISEINALIEDGYRITNKGELKPKRVTAIVWSACVITMAILAFVFREKIRSLFST